MSAASLEHKLTVIKYSVTTGSHAAARPLPPRAEQGWSPGRPGGSRATGASLASAPPPAALARPPLPGCTGSARPCLANLQRRKSGAQRRPPSETACKAEQVPALTFLSRVALPPAVPDAAAVGASGLGRKRARPASSGPPS